MGMGIAKRAKMVKIAHSNLCIGEEGCYMFGKNRAYVFILVKNVDNTKNRKKVVYGLKVDLCFNIVTGL